MPIKRFRNPGDTMPVTERDMRHPERRLFLLVAVLFPLVLLAGFGRSAAISYRRRPSDHKRLILLTILNCLPPAIARLPGVGAAGPLGLFGLPALLAITILILDTWHNAGSTRYFYTEPSCGSPPTRCG